MMGTAPSAEAVDSSNERRWQKIMTNLRYDIPASLVVFLVAMPLSLGIALASGAPIAAGLIAAVIGGIVAGACGGSILQVSGPAAGLTVIMAESINTFGWAMTCAITVVAGALQIVLGLSRIARAALAISPAIVHGMLAGIGITIVLAQLHVVLGGAAQSSPILNIRDLPQQIVDHHDEAVLIGLATITILLVWNRLPAMVRKIPGPLAAVLLVTILASVMQLDVDRITLPGDLLDVHFVPVFPSGGWFQFIIAVVTIAMVASVESLLSAVATDKMHTGQRANLNRELVGQGIANMASGSVGGLPVTGVIVRSSTNVYAGAKTRMSAVLHGVWILLFVALLAGVLQNIPLAALAGLLVYVGAKLVNIAHIKDVLRHGDLPVYLITLGGVVAIDLLRGVLIGMAVAAVMMLRRLLWSGIHAERDGNEWRVVVEGALASLSIPRLTSVLAEIPQGSTVTLELVVDYLDHAAFESLSSWQHAHEAAGGTVIVDEIGHPWFGSGKAGAPTVYRRDAGRFIPRWFAPWSDWQLQQEDSGTSSAATAEESDLAVASVETDSHSGAESTETATKTGTELAAPLLPQQRVGSPPSSSVRRGMMEFQRRTARFIKPTLRRLVNSTESQVLFITCGDSRIVPNVITSSGPGDLFAVRNIGNLVPSMDANTLVGDASVAAAVEYAVGVQKVREVVVCGHSSCGAMKALLHGTPPNTPGLNAWLRHAQDSVERFRAQPDVHVDGQVPSHDYDRLALHNILQQLDRLRDYPVIADALARNEISLVGMYFDLADAQVHVYDDTSEIFVSAEMSLAKKG